MLINFHNHVLLQLTGCGLLATGLWLRFGYEGYVSLLPQYALLSVDNISMIIGGIIIVYAFFGCCGSWFENRCLLITVSLFPFTFAYIFCLPEI